MLIFSPYNILPDKIDYLMSQIDVAPTLLGLLNFSYTSKFFGFDIFKTTPDQRRVFISTYQLLGYLKNNTLTILEPQQKTITSFYKTPGNDVIQSSLKITKQMETEAIAWYETASHSFRNNLLHN